jgi:chaperonin cofactor prefoldin
MEITGCKTKKAEEVYMKYRLSLSLALATCFCFALIASAIGHPQEATTPLTLEQAAKGLDDAAKDKTIPFSTPLQKAVAEFVQAAKTPEEKVNLKKKTEALQTALTAEQQRPGYIRGKKVNAIEDAITAANEVLHPDAKNRQTPSPPPSPSGSIVTNDDNEKGLTFTGLLVPVLGAIAAAGLIVLLTFGLLRLRRGYWARFDHHVSGIIKAHNAELKQRQDELGKQVLALTNQHQSASTRLESIESELQALGRRVRGMSDGGGYQGESTRAAFDEYSRSQPVPVEPEFPASVSDYLSKMKRNSTVVKPDFQNGILVSDLDGKGELVLIRDTKLADSVQPLFLVPRVPQFQTKQEFHSYYERYYECQRPSAGDVWIIDPAIVSTVPGGWELREKGVLEVR